MNPKRKHWQPQGCGSPGARNGRIGGVTEDGDRLEREGKYGTQSLAETQLRSDTFSRLSDSNEKGRPQAALYGILG